MKFIFGIIIASMFNKNKSIGNGPKSVTPPKPPLPPIKKVGDYIGKSRM